MTRVAAFELACPSCGAKSRSFRPISGTYWGTYTDLQRKSLGIEPSCFLAHSCPECAYTGPDDWFQAPVPARLKELIRNNLTPLSGEVVREHAWLKFEYTARIAEWKALPPEEIADYYHTAAYLCACLGSGRPSKQEEIYRKKAIEFLLKALGASTIAEESVPQVTYLIGELYRRIGSRESSATWLKRAERLARPHKDLKWLAKLARQQRTRPRNMMESGRQKPGPPR
jgi:hypothetical protein